MEKRFESGSAVTSLAWLKDDIEIYFGFLLEQSLPDLFSGAIYVQKNLCCTITLIDSYVSMDYCSFKLISLFNKMQSLQNDSNVHSVSFGKHEILLINVI